MTAIVIDEKTYGRGGSAMYGPFARPRVFIPDRTCASMLARTWASVKHWLAAIFCIAPAYGIYVAGTYLRAQRCCTCTCCRGRHYDGTVSIDVHDDLAVSLSDDEAEEADESEEDGSNWPGQVTLDDVDEVDEARVTVASDVPWSAFPPPTGPSQ